MAQVSSYVLTFQGTTPAEPKAPEGIIWEDKNSETTKETAEVVTDTTSVTNTLTE